MIGHGEHLSRDFLLALLRVLPAIMLLLHQLLLLVRMAVALSKERDGLLLHRYAHRLLLFAPLVDLGCVENLPSIGQRWGHLLLLCG